MPPFTLPIDPLLQQALIARDPIPGVDDNSRPQPGALNDNGDNPGSSSDEDDEWPPNANKRPRLGVDAENIAANTGDQVRHQETPDVVSPLQVPPSLRQYAQNLITLKKLSDNSQQELHRYTMVLGFWL
jgi:hypothetical protein